MNIALRIRPLPTHPLTLPATLETRATQDILGPQGFDSMSGDPTPQLLNHPPVMLVHAEGGEVLLNRDAVVCQLQLKGDGQAPAPKSLVVYALEAATLDMSLRSLHFLYGQLQTLNYHKKDGNDNLLAEVAANALNTDRVLYTAIAQDIFGRTTLEHRHYKVLFSAANLGDRSIRNLKDKTNIKDKKNKKKETPNIDTGLKKSSAVPMNITVDNNNTTAVATRGSACGHSPQEEKHASAMRPPSSQSPKISSHSDDGEEHQLGLALIEEDA
jgi:hypothetical protein